MELLPAKHIFEENRGHVDKHLFFHLCNHPMYRSWQMHKRRCFLWTQRDGKSVFFVGWGKTLFSSRRFSDARQSRFCWRQESRGKRCNLKVYGHFQWSVVECRPIRSPFDSMCLRIVVTNVQWCFAPLPRTVYLVVIMMDFRHAELSFSSPLKPVKSPKSRGVLSKHHSNCKI